MCTIYLLSLKLYKCLYIISCSQLFSSTVPKLSCTTLAPYCWCAKVSSFQQVWKAKRWESKCMKVMLSAKPFLLLSYTCTPLPCTTLLHSGIKSKSISNQLMASQLFWLMKLKKNCWCAIVSSFQYVWKAKKIRIKVYEIHVVTEALPTT